MTSITINLDLSVVHGRVVAQERGNPVLGGNIGAANNDVIIWHHAGGTPHRFEVKFYKFPNLTKLEWPFKPNDPTNILHVETTADNPRTFGVGWHVYYAVRVPADLTIVPLDPMIIIRRSRNLVALAAALVGALVGALLTWVVRN